MLMPSSYHTLSRKQPRRCRFSFGGYAAPFQPRPTRSSAQRLSACVSINDRRMVCFPFPSASRCMPSFSLCLRYESRGYSAPSFGVNCPPLDVVAVSSLCSVKHAHYCYRTQSQLLPCLRLCQSPVCYLASIQKRVLH
jgi:hypothetical protein